MLIEGWKYYNHAAIPDCAPHNTPNLSPVENGTIWRLRGRPLLARWTSEFNCGYETNWWYNVRFSPFSIEQLSKSSQKHIRQSLRKCDVRRVNASTLVNELYAVYCSSFARYENADNMSDYQSFRQGCEKDLENGCEFWAGFHKKTDAMIGYMKVRPYDTYAELHTAKFVPQYLNCGISDALYFTVLEHYLCIQGKAYVSSGSRNINHKTNTENYKIKHFGYEKVYCKLHIKYAPIVGITVKILYLFRKLLLQFDNITIIHQINAVLKMEEIVRNEK